MTHATHGTAAALVTLAAMSIGCGDPDPCDGIDDTCIAIRVTSDLVDEIDQLELDLLFGATHSTVTTQLDGGGAASLPVATAISLDAGSADRMRVGIVAAGKLGGNVLGTGAATVEVTVAEREARVSIVLAAIVECVAGSFYCGGDKVAGDAQTLYQCNAGGVPLARGLCTAGCTTNPGDDDACRAVGGPCSENGRYCGGNELAGDPQSLYRCAAGAGVDRVACPTRCVVAPSGSDDYCE